ncbi:lipopolysaccharide-induced tumor necrosis factor-alpha factor [Drosophila busckii]|nr:lipopolysaccharide-induced tumor necrosis factor-alpha factor [Drosophila busckii]
MEDEKQSRTVTEQPTAAAAESKQVEPPPSYGYTPAQNYQPYPAGPTQPPLYPPMQPPGNTCVIVHHTPTVPMRVPVGTEPTFVRCPSCQADVVTVIENKPTSRTHLAALILCLVGCWPCVCVPYCMNSCKSTEHYCPICRAHVGSHH